LIWWSKSLLAAAIMVLVSLWVAPYLMTQWKASFTRIVDKLAWFQGKYEGLKNVGYYERVVLGSISLKHWYVNMVDSVNRLMETECVVGYMLDPQLDAYLPQAWSSLDEEGAVRSMRGEKRELLELLKEKKGIVFRDSLIHELANDRAREIDEMMEILSAHLCVSFSDGERIVGFITVGRKLKKGIFHFKTDDINFDSLRQTLDLAMTEDKNLIKTIERINKRLDVEKGPFNSSDRELLDALNALVDDKGFLNEIDLNDLDLRSEGIQLLKKYQDGTHLPKRKHLVLQTAILRSLFKNEIRPGPEDLINAEDIDALSLLFSAGQETLMVMTTAVTQQKRSAEWAHDLRQPFDKGNFLLIQDLASGRLGPVTLDQKRALFAIKEDSEFVRRKLESLINPQGDNLQMGDYDVQVLLQIFKLKIQPLCTHHQISLKVDLPEQSTKIRCDAEILNFRVLGNLSDNAIRHTPPGGNIHLGVEQREDNIILFIRNTGGDPIPPELIPNLFDRGSQGNTNGGMAGLGLFNVAQAMEAHGGKVWVESSKEAGTTFFLQFPAVV
jgi:signal transduction histidine kinase